MCYYEFDLAVSVYDRIGVFYHVFDFLLFLPKHLHKHLKERGGLVYKYLSSVPRLEELYTIPRVRVVFICILQESVLYCISGVVFACMHRSDAVVGSQVFVYMIGVKEGFVVSLARVTHRFEFLVEHR